MLKETIYSTDTAILNIIENEFDLIDENDWYQLYQNKAEKTFWRLDKSDKYQEQVFVRLSSNDNWTCFDDTDLRIELLQNSRGIEVSRKCIWKDCNSPSLKGLVYCAYHAFKEMGIRK